MKISIPIIICLCSFIHAVTTKITVCAVNPETTLEILSKLSSNEERKAYHVQEVPIGEICIPFSPRKLLVIKHIENSNSETPIIIGYELYYNTKFNQSTEELRKASYTISIEINCEDFIECAKIALSIFKLLDSPNTVIFKDDFATIILDEREYIITKNTNNEVAHIFDKQSYIPKAIKKITELQNSGFPLSGLSYAATQQSITL